MGSLDIEWGTAPDVLADHQKIDLSMMMVALFGSDYLPGLSLVATSNVRKNPSRIFACTHLWAVVGDGRLTASTPRAASGA